MEPKKPVQALKDPSWVEAMQDELLRFKLLKVWTLVDLPRDKWAIVKPNGRKSALSNIGNIEEGGQTLQWRHNQGIDKRGRAEDVARFQVTPNTSHLNAMRENSYRYLKGQPKLSIWYLRDLPFDLEDFLIVTMLELVLTGNPQQEVGDEAIHKELGDRMERAATTASSLKAEQDNGSGPRCQDTILGDVDAQTRFETTSKQFSYPPLSKVNTFGSGEDSMQLMELMTHCTKLSALATANAKMVNGVRQLQALIDKKKMFITESSIRSDLHLEDAEDGGVKFLLYPRSLQVFINQQLGDMSHHKKIYVNPSHTKKIFANMKRAGKDFSGRITLLFDTMMVQASEEVGEDLDHPTNSNQIPIRKEAAVAHDETEHEESVPTPSNDPLPSGKDSMQLNDLMVLCTKFQKQVLDLEKAKSDQAIEIASLKKRVDKLEKRRKFRTTWIKILKKVGAARRIESSNDSLGAQEDDEDLMFDNGVLDGDEMFVDAITSEKDEQSTKLNDSTAGEAVTTALPTIPTTVEETLA
ncbi:hypothetical protein Tco_0721573 [Tanacetum coccineum]